MRDHRLQQAEWHLHSTMRQKKRWPEYKELYRKGFNDPDNHDGVGTHLEPDILEAVSPSEPWRALLRTKLVDMIEFS